jgi:biotin carboxyl carrier protein
VPDDAFVRRIGAAVYVQRDGHEWCFDDLRFVPQQVARRDDAGGEMRAPMSARVTAVLRGDGSSMRRGEPILTLEAMKVEHWIAAPFDGRVVSMQVRAGQQVAGGSLLAVVAPADPTTDN